MDTFTYTYEYGKLIKYKGEDRSYRGIVTGGGYDSNSGFYCTIFIFGYEEMTFKINDPIVYDEIISTYLSRKEIGIILR